ncbi:MAG: phenylacetate--CoA ligase family protein [Deltaproteobacteria bacterium]|jgi:phenylacetate-CoA ligase|nr:phenylacetate--CoA ligase family protein [Deltaproteobacteria bacterium]
MKKEERLRGYHDEQLETLPWEEKKQLLENQLQRAVLIAFEEAPAMREKFNEAGMGPTDIRSLEDLQSLAITPKAQMRQLQQASPPFGGFLGVDMDKLRRIYTSPGAIFDPEGHQADYWRLQGVFFNTGFRPADRVLNTFSYHLTPGGLMCDEGLSGIGCSVVPGGIGNTETQVQLMEELKLTGYVGVPSFLQAIIERAEQEGKDFRRDCSLEIAVTAGEMLTDVSRRRLEEDYGILVRQFLATADVGAIAYECGEKNGMHFADYRITEVVDPETGKQLGAGQVGEVVVTLLENPVYPLIRFGTGDLSYYEDEPCPCGRTSPRLMKLVGRVDQVTKVRGMFIHPSQVEEVVAAFPEIQAAQAVVEREQDRDKLTFCAVLAEPSSQEGLAPSLQEKIRTVLKLRADVTFVQAGDLRESEKRILDLRKWD